MEQSKFYKIKNITEDKYTLVGCDGSETIRPIQEVGKTASVFTIQDAKEGDVIFSNDGHGSDSIELIKSVYDKCINFWFCLSSKNNFKDYYYEVYNGNIPYTNFASRKDATPATRKQRDLLFAKMKEAGYEWDAEKKELKKIDARENLVLDGDLMQADCMIVEQKPAWSEEDDYILNLVSKFTSKGYKSHPKIPSLEFVQDWLKSLKERYNWKPSDRQMKQLGWVAEQNKDNALGKELMTLYQDLKKLREE